MIRKTAFIQVGGFNADVVAGEEPELCYRLRKENGIIFRIDYPMTLHDAAIMTFTQWWKRCLRAGHAYAQGFTLHLFDGKGYCFRESVRIWFWAIMFPLGILILAITIDPAFVLLAAVYPIQVIRISLRTFKWLKNAKISVFYGFYMMLGKWPELVGQLLFYKRRLLRNTYSIIEYS